MTKRLFDIMISAAAALVLAIPALLVALMVKATSRGPVLFWSYRVGQDNQMFCMPKFRTMRVETPVVATHELADPRQFLTTAGGFLRRTSLDEIPQLWCILTGDMSLVGPRPALFNQRDLIALRMASGVHLLKPGLTGWAQVNGRDELTSEQKAEFDLQYLKRKSIAFDLRILFLTVLKVFGQAGVSH
jgi:O-antigen biosynthesis protein WbqP